ncbi:MAG: hypothetical protein H6985_20025 [Pseudomonadales bacterium]|nr:hypothetical protein [Pseudomonadales bacterium]
MSKVSTEKAKGLKRILVAIGVTAAVIYLIALAVYFFHFNGNVSDGQSIWGAFGDFIGGTTNPIFSFLALVAILMSLAIQMDELHLTRDELKGSKEALEKQNSSLEAQNFQNTFFRLLDFLRDLHANAGAVNSKENTTGGFDKYFKEIIIMTKEPKIDDDSEYGYEPGSEDRYNAITDHFVKTSINPELGRYLRTLNMLSDLIATAPGANPNRQIYFDILAAQFTRGEMLLMFFLAPNAHSPIHQMMPAIGKYGLLKNLGQDGLVYTREYIVQYYTPDAFSAGVPQMAKEWTERPKDHSFFS